LDGAFWVCLFSQLFLPLSKIVFMKYGEITEKVIGGAFRVHTALGNGFQEVIY
jgi:hypothetical protein